jgi:hypothetical protein
MRSAEIPPRSLGETREPSQISVPGQALPGISLVMLVNNPAHQVAAIAGIFKNYVDEILIGVDHRVDVKTLGPILEVADRCLRVQFDTGYANSGWLIKRAHHEWVIVVDGDEVPSQALLRRLKSIPTLNGRATHAYVQRRWVWPTSNQYIVQDPWRDDPQLRIVKRDARILNWPTSIHESPKVDGTGVHIPESLYHLDLLANAVEAREQKVETYETYSTRKHPGLDVSINRAYYLPEHLPMQPPLKAIDTIDLVNVQHVLNTALLETSSSYVSDIEVVTTSDLATDASSVGYSVTEYECSLQVLEVPTQFSTHIPTRVSIVVTNTGSWPYQPYRGDGGVAVGWHIHSQDGNVFVQDAGRSPLTIILEPQESVVLQCEIVIPNNLHQFAVKFDLVEEGYAWFNKSVEIVGSITELN